LKTGYSKYEIGIYFFYNIKKIQTYKINIPENKSLSLSLFFQKKKSKEVRLGHLPKQVTRLDTKRGGKVQKKLASTVQMN
jgi:hypothetical protein